MKALLLSFLCIFFRFLSPNSPLGCRHAPSAAVTPPCRPARFQDRAHALDAIGFREIVDHGDRRHGIGFVERLLDLTVEGALADRERRAGLLRDGSGERLRLFERPALRDDTVDEAE